MAILKKTGKLSQVSISVLGGIAHNIGQDHLCGSYRPDTRGILLSAISSGSRSIAGTLIGIVGGIITERLQRAMRGIKKIK